MGHARGRDSYKLRMKRRRREADRLAKKAAAAPAKPAAKK
jgi:hypothetical protein